MTRKQKDPLREITGEERRWLKRMSRSSSEPASHVARAKAILSVAEGGTYTAAAQAAGRKSADAVSQWVQRFNEAGIGAIRPRHGGGPAVKYDATARQRILAQARGCPDPQQDGTATWSLLSLQKALRKAEDGLPKVSTHTIGKALHEAGLSWQRTRSWTQTGQVVRQRKGKQVMVIDGDAEAKKT